MDFYYSKTLFSRVLLSSLLVLLCQSGLFAQSALYELNWADSSEPLFTNGGSHLTQTIDSACSEVGLSVTDPTGSPLPAHKSLVINPKDGTGTDIADLSGNTSFFIRVRSKDSVRLGFQLRSGDGSTPNRTVLQEAIVPGDTANWTDITFTLDASNIGGFDSTDLRDVWIFLDKGVVNFAGDEMYFDYFSIGATPDPVNNSTCLSAASSTFPYIIHWADASAPLFTNGGTSLTQTIDSSCSQVGIAVTDPAGAPLPAHKSLVINPKDASGNDIADLSGNTSFFIRVRSKDSVRLGFQLRSGDGSTPNRTVLQEAIVPGDTATWTEITFTLDASNIGGFDSTDLRDVWLFLDKGDLNFAGNEMYFDYFSIGSMPDPSGNSMCPVGPPPSDFPYILHWASTSEPTFTNGGFQLTQTIDSACSQVRLSVADPTGAPLPAQKSLVINPKDASGNDLSDFSGQTSFFIRVRSKDSVRLGFQLRSGDGSTPNRSVLQEVVVPGDLTAWSEFTFTLDSTNIGGFDSTDLRDVWIFLDKGTVNFAGDEMYVDYFAIGSKPDPANNSTCVESPPSSDFPYILHWASTSEPTFTNGGFQLTQTIDSACSQVRLSVTDPIGAPLPAQKSLVINPKDASGNDLSDFSGQTSFFLRVRSKDSVRVGFQLRSGDGSTPNRSVLQEVVVPGDLTAWSEFTFTLDSTNIGGFDSTDLRDVWIFLDKGMVNFSGDEMYVDYFAIGSKPDPANNSTCVETPAFAFPYVLHWADTLDGGFSGTGADPLTQIVDTACSQLQVSVTDPVGAPLEAFKQLIFNPKDDAGNDISDLSGQMSFNIRLRSKDSIRLGFLLRSGDGTTPNRSDRQEVIVPGDLTDWTEITFTLDTTNIGGFDSTDLRDVWFYLDRGDANFAGNELYIDYFSIGAKPDPAQNSTCTSTPPFEFPYVIHWADTTDRLFTNGGTSLTQTIDTTCSQLGVSVTDPTGAPLPAHKSLVINPKDELDNEIADFSGQLRFYTRVRSKDSLRLGFQLRSGDGSTPNRTALQEVVVPGDLTTWTDVSFIVDASNIGGFDSTDLRDVWIFLDKGDLNFAGDELYFDYFSIGSTPDPAANSTCVQSVGIEELTTLEALKIYPNPSHGNQAIRLAFTAQESSEMYLRIYDSSGKLMSQEGLRVHPGPQEHTIQPNEWASGIYTIQLVDQGKVRTVKWLID